MSEPVSPRNPRFAIDVGGTFTDCLALWPDGQVTIRKVLSSGQLPAQFREANESGEALVDGLEPDLPPDFFQDFELRTEAGPLGRVNRSEPCDGGHRLTVEPRPAQFSKRLSLHAPVEAPLLGVRLMLRLPMRSPIPPIEIRLGTTLATNALLERRFPEPVLVVTRGFPDLLEIGFQNRPGLFELRIPEPEPLTRRVIEAEERLDAQGEIVQPLAEAPLCESLRSAKEAGYESVAISFLHAYLNPAHEERAAELARELGFSYIHLSHEAAALPRYVSRTETIALDAALAPVIADYVRRLAAQAPEARFRFMTSTGALVPAERFPGREAVLSGPAGGVMAMEWLSQQGIAGALVGFDMGGTSTDVSRYAGKPERRYEMELPAPGGERFLRVVAPSLRIDTVAAGGGSVCRFDGVKTVVGPESCGSQPGPACYGAGGPLAVTDLNAFLGKLPAFPFPLDNEATRRRLEDLARNLERETGQHYGLEHLAEGLTRVANANMAAPIRTITVGRGVDPRDDTLVSFGGAAAQHACAIARELGIRRVLCSPLAGVFSAVGIAVTHPQAFAERAVNQLADERFFADTLPKLREVLEQQTRDELGPPPEEAQWRSRLRLEMQFAGQESRLALDEPEADDWLTAFRRQHQKQFGFLHEGRSILVFAARLEAGWSLPAPAMQIEESELFHDRPETVQTWFDGAWRTTPLLTRDDFDEERHVEGPAIIIEPASTICLEPGWQAGLDDMGNLILSAHTVSGEVSKTGETDPDPIDLELFENRFSSIAEQMGEVLRTSAVSTNVKERLDFSCALFDSRGGLVVNAPHIPVHLGAMESCVRCVMADRTGQWVPDASYITNDPQRGGSHLPDVTVVTPLFLGEKEEPSFFVANRAHHAEIGGRTPGSMPPDATSLEEEGVLIQNFAYISGAPESEAELRRLFESEPYPSRAPAENLADLHAQMAANRFGQGLLNQLIQLEGAERVECYMQHLQSLATVKTCAALAKLSFEERRFSDQLDDGSIITVRISRREGERPCLDFTGSAPVHAGNFNANQAITRSAVLYVLRLLIGEPIALNAGILEAVDLIIPSPSLLDPGDTIPAPATAAGNVETSQRIVDVLMGALELAAASQGTMNNLLFGSNDPEDAFGFYETLGGGSGAGPGFSGAPAVHTHMTNSRITDPEILEMRYPVRLVAWKIRTDSGGTGRYRGGDGMIRHLQFLKPVTLSLLTSRRETAPYGLHGGSAGRPGRNDWRSGSDQEWQALPFACSVAATTGSEIKIATPGGGAYGVV